MNTNDWIGTLGVGIILLAFYLNTKNIIQSNGLPYLILNTAGGALACTASILIDYKPFIILEGIWTLISIWGIIKSL